MQARLSRSLIGLMSCFPIIFSPQSIANQAVSATAGTSGLGVEFTSGLSENLRFRVLLNTLQLDEQTTEEGIDYDAEWSSTNIGALLDWHPFKGRFRISGGVLRTDFSISLDSEANQQNYDIGDRTYSGEVSLEGELNYGHAAPYIALGWASNLTDSGLYFSAELGALFIGNPQLKVDANGTATSPDINNGNPIDISNHPEFQADLETERQNLLNEIGDFNVYPVLQFGLGAKF